MNCRTVNGTPKVSDSESVMSGWITACDKKSGCFPANLIKVKVIHVMDRPRILVIDDDSNLSRTLADILRVKGYEAVSAANGAEALALLRENPVNLALIDIGLPDISGVEVLKRIKADYPSTEAIILTGNASLDSAIEAANSGAFSYLVKPYDIEQLMLNIRRGIEKRQAEEDRERLILELRAALAKVKQLEGIIPICSYCKKIRDDQESWQQLESYITEHSEALFSHGICPECYIKVTNETLEELERERQP
jgi:CheY-like chemotaxis protein